MASKPGVCVEMTESGKIELDSKREKIDQAEKQLDKIWSFLSHYLPLANSQAVDFITTSLWNRLIPEKIQRELFQLPEEILQQIPLGEETITSSLSCLSLSDEDGCQLSDIKWRHSTLRSFIHGAKSLHLEQCCLLTEIDDLKGILKLQSVKSDFSGILMSEKKCHEVDVMAALCSHLAKSMNTNLIVDLGSGKGYLSTQLCHEFGHHVIGVDCCNTNTHSASERAKKLEQDWTARVKTLQKSKTREKKLTENGGSNSDPKVYSRLSAAKGKKRLESDSELVKDLIESSDSIDCFCRGSKLTTNRTGLVSSSAVLDASACLSDCSRCEKTVPEIGASVLTEFKSGIQSDLFVTQKCIKIENGCSGGSERNSLLPKCSLLPSPNRISGCDTFLCVCTNMQAPSVFDNSHSDPFSDKITKSKRKQDSQGQFIPVTKFVDCKTRLMDSIGELTQELGVRPSDAHILLTGLHTCGGLAASMIRLFVQSPSVPVMCNVGCCYHLLEEEFLNDSENVGNREHLFGDFPMSRYLRDKKVSLGRAARNLACLSVHRMAGEQQLQGRAFYPRALLQKIMCDVLGDVHHGDTKLRKLGKRSQSLFDYVSRAFNKLGLPSEQVTEDMVRDYDKKYNSSQHQLSLFVQIRAVLAPCIESLVLVDQYLYLLEQEEVEDAFITRMFDPVISPRCHAIIAVKKSAHRASEVVKSS